MKLALTSALGITMMLATPLAAQNTSESTKIVSYTVSGDHINSKYLVGRFESNYKSINSAYLDVTNNTNESLIYRFLYDGNTIIEETFNNSKYLDVTGYFIDLDKKFGTDFTITLLPINGNYLFDGSATLKIEYSTKELYSNGVDAELYKMGVKTHDYYSSMENQIVALTDKYDNNRHQELLVFYVFNPYPTKAYSTSNISYCYMDEIDESEEIKFLTHRVEIEYLESNGSGYFQKYIAKDIPIIQSKYKAYKITKLSYDDDTFDVYNSVFKFTQNSDGTIDYVKEQLDVIELENENVVNVLSDSLEVKKDGVNNIFYGFDIKNYDISKLLEIEVVYDEYDYEVVTFGTPDGYSETVASHEGVFEEEYIKEKINNYELILSSEELKTIEKYYPTYSKTKSNITKKITSDDESIIESNKWYFGSTPSIKWDSIIKVDDIDKHIDDNYIKAAILKKFSNNEFVITIEQFEAFYSKSSNYEDKVTFYGTRDSRSDELYKYFEEHGKKCPLRMWQEEKYISKNYYYGGDFPIKHYSKNCLAYCQSKTVKNLETVRLKFFDQKNNEYDLSVISTPIDAIDYDDGSSGSSNIFSDWIKKQIGESFNEYITIFINEALVLFNQYALIFILVAAVLCFVAFIYIIGSASYLLKPSIEPKKPNSYKKNNNYYRKKR